MSGTSAALTRAEAAAMQKKVDLTPRGGRESGLKGEGGGEDPQMCVPNSTRGNQKSATRG